jgi:hypothetical protein
MSMCLLNTPVEHYPQFGLHVKREDLSCPPGPHFSKTRGVYAHVATRPEKTIGVLDTNHSQGGWAVAQACRLLNKQCVVFYPVRVSEDWGSLKLQQLEAQLLNAVMMPLKAGRSAVLYHQAKKELAKGWGDFYMMPNALKLPEMVTETAAEAVRTKGLNKFKTIIVSASSGTIAAGVRRGLEQSGGYSGRFVVHQGYTRPVGAIRGYMEKMAGMQMPDVELVDEGYGYADEAAHGSSPPFPCNRFYDLKAFRWWLRQGYKEHGEALLWNIG